MAEQTPLYNIKAVVKQTGLNPATLRAWERRYGIPVPGRSQGGHRQYSQRDVDTLLWLIDRQNEGLSISHAVDLFRSLEEAGQDPLQPEAEPQSETGYLTSALMELEQVDDLRDEWLEACLNFDRSRADQILTGAFALFPPEVVCLEVMLKGLSIVGSRWQEGKISVQQEHFTSALALQRMEMLVASAPPPSRKDAMIVAGAPGEEHIFSALLMTFLLRRRGYNVIFLNANLPAADLQKSMESIQPRLILATAQMLTSAAGLLDMADEAASFGIPLAFGGLIFNQIERLKELIPGYYLGETIEEAIETAAGLMDKPLPSPSKRNLPASYQEALSNFQSRLSLIEAHVWTTFSTKELSTKKLSEINRDIAQIIEAALKLGDIDLLDGGFHQLAYYLVSYRLTEDYLRAYIQAYHQAAEVHLDGPAKMVVAWLAGLLGEK